MQVSAHGDYVVVDGQYITRREALVRAKAIQDFNLGLPEVSREAGWEDLVEALVRAADASAKAVGQPYASKFVEAFLRRNTDDERRA